MHRAAGGMLLRADTPRLSTVPPLSARRRMQLLSYAVSIRPEDFAQPITISMTMHALERLHLEPPLDELRRWNHLLRAVDLSVDGLDYRSVCNVLHSLSTMLGRVFKPRQDLVLPSTAQRVLVDRLQGKLFDGVVSLSTAQTLLCVESLRRLRCINLAHTSLFAVVCERTPVLADQVVRPKDFDTLVRVVSSTEQEWQNPDVVADVTRNVRRAVATHQDAIRLFDALTRRNLENGAIVTRPVPQPLQPLLEHLYGVALRQVVEMPPSQLSAWYSRVFDEWCAHHSEEFSSRTLAATMIEHSEAAQPEPVCPSGQQLMVALSSKLQRPSTLEGVSDKALRTLAMTTCQMWALPKQESEVNVDVDDQPRRNDVSGQQEEVRRTFFARRASLIGVTYLGGKALLAAVVAEVRSRWAREPAERLDTWLDVILAMPRGMLQDGMATSGSHAVNDELSKGVLALLRDHVLGTDADVSRQRIASIVSPRTRATLVVFVVCFGLDMLRAARSTLAMDQGSALIHSILAATSVDRLNLTDAIYLVNELCTLVYAMDNPLGVDKGSSRRAKEAPVLASVHAFLTSVHVNNVLVALRYKRRSNDSPLTELHLPRSNDDNTRITTLRDVSTGQLVRYASSMSKLGIRKKMEYMHFVLQLGRRALTGFEVVRLCHVLARHSIYAPYLEDVMGERIVSLRTSLKPKQKVLLIKALGQLNYDWPSIAAATSNTAPSIISSTAQSAFAPSSESAVVAGDGGETWFVPRAAGERLASPRVSAVVPRRGVSFTEPQRSLPWFLYDVVPSSMDTLSLVHLLCAWTKLQLNADLKAARVKQNARPWWSPSAGDDCGTTIPSGDWVGPLIVQVLTILEANPNSIRRVASCAKVGDVLVALTLLRMAPAQEEGKHHQGPLVSDNVFHAVANHLAAVVGTTRNPFLDLNAVSLWWPFVQQVLQPCAAAGDASSVADEPLATLAAAIQQKVLQRLQSIATSATLSPNTFLYAQLRMAVVFDLVPDQRPQRQVVVGLDWVQWARLVAAMPVDGQLTHNTLKEPSHLADTQSIVDVATILYHHHHALSRRLSDAAAQPPSDQLVAFAHVVLPSVWGSSALQQWEREAIATHIKSCIPEWSPPTSHAQIG